MRGLLIVMLTYVLLGVESPILHHLELTYFVPDVALIAVLFTAYTFEDIEGLIVAMCIGLLHDAFSMGAPIGMFTEICVLSYLMARLVFRKLSVTGAVPLMGITFAASILSSLLFFVFAAIFDREFNAFGMILTVMVPNALVTAPFTPLLFPLYDWALSRTTHRRNRKSFLS